MELSGVGLAFTAGFLATLAPCSLPMLPSYIAYYMNLQEGEGDLSRAIRFALTTVAGFLTVYLIVGVLPSFAVGNLTARFTALKPIIGAALIAVGLLQAYSNIFDRIPAFSFAAPERAGLRSFFVYGVGYGAASLACSFPIFLLLVVQAGRAGGAVNTLLVFASYGAGAAAMILPLTVGLSLGMGFISTRLMKVIPYVKKVNSLVLIAAGLYMILAP